MSFDRRFWNNERAAANENPAYPGNMQQNDEGENQHDENELIEGPINIVQPNEDQLENDADAFEPDNGLPAQEENPQEEDFLRLNPPVELENKPSLIPEKPRCPITLTTLTSETKVLGAPDGQVYDAEAISQWLTRKTRSPINPDMIFGPHRLFNPVAFRQATEYAEHQEAKYQKLKAKYKLKKVEKAELSVQVVELKQENQQLLADKHKLESKLQHLTHQNKLFKTHVKRKANELIETIEQQTQKNVKRKLR